MKGGQWDARIHRANELASVHPFASEGLRFYARLAQFQKSLYEQIRAECGSARVARVPGTLRQELDVFLLLPRFPGFLSVVVENAPAPLARTASELRAREAGRWQEILLEFWEARQVPPRLQAAEELLAWIFLQPYAEYLAEHSDWGSLQGTPPVCPLCGSKPQVGVLRPEGDGAKRSLICALCLKEWDFRRIACPACGEEDVHKLAIYTAQEFSHVRVEACDTCHLYIKTVDLTKDGHAVPVADELATIPLNLWANEHGYQKLQTNLLGI
jgi:FdhE protein